MTDEVQTGLAEATESAPTPEATAVPGAENTPEIVDEASKQPEERKFSQAELDELISKRLAREQRKWERKQQQRAPDVMPDAPPQPDQFESPQAYAQHVRAEAKRLLEAERAQEQRATVVESYHEREEAARDKYHDFEQVAYNPNLRITDVMLEVIQASESGPDLAYWLGQNPKEADRIAKLSPFLQAKEVGRIEAKLADAPPAKKTTAAPEPIRPLKARAADAPSYDTTDPRSVKSMSTSQWIEAERARQMKKIQAQANR